MYFRSHVASFSSPPILTPSCRRGKRYKGLLPWRRLAPRSHGFLTVTVSLYVTVTTGNMKKSASFSSMGQRTVPGDRRHGHATRKERFARFILRNYDPADVQDGTGTGSESKGVHYVRLCVDHLWPEHAQAKISTFLVFTSALAG